MIHAQLTRRQVLVSAAVGAAGLILVPDTTQAAAPESAGSSPDGLLEQGVGMYTDPSVASQISSFSINRSTVTCGVGTLAGPDFTGPFAMLMYALQIKNYRVDQAAKTITCAGRMRSITKVAGTTAEDVQHDFLAIAAAGDGPTGRFDVHLVTPFWNPSNPMSTHSTVVAGWVRFGGALLIGEIAL
jgi:hypothetical protein